MSRPEFPVEWGMLIILTAGYMRNRALRILITTYLKFSLTIRNK
jgi:hypothetical protein